MGRTKAGGGNSSRRNSSGGHTSAVAYAKAKVPYVKSWTGPTTIVAKLHIIRVPPAGAVEPEITHLHLPMQLALVIDVAYSLC